GACCISTYSASQPPAFATIAISTERARGRFIHSTSSAAANFSFIDFSGMRFPPAMGRGASALARPMSSDETRDHNALSAAITASSTSMYAFGAAALALAERALRWDANFLDARPPRRRLDRLHQLGHLRRERVPGQKGAGT